MHQTQTSLPLLSGNGLKLVAALTMLIDHVGMLLFPQVLLLRIIGRLAFPIYAFMIAEGCRYTKNKLRYFLMVFLLGAMCQVVFYVFSRSLYMCVLVTFSLSILVIYALQWCQAGLADAAASVWRKGLGVLAFCAAVAAVWVINRHVAIDYGFWGCMLGVFPALCPKSTSKDRVLALGVGLAILAGVSGGIQVYSLLALPLLLLYSGRRGRLNLKYFFYIFYPVHLAVLQGIQLLLSR